MGAIDEIMSRLAAIGDGTDTYAAYKNLGAGTIVAEDYEDIEVKLDYAADNFAALDRFGRLMDQAWTDYGANPDTVLDEYTYEYDRAGNRTAKANELNHDFDETYEYDSLDRLVSADRDNGFDQSWTLDGLGNFSGFDDDGSSQTRTANAANEITGITGGWVSPAYDAAGNMISGPKPGSGTTRVHYLYDAWNRLVIAKADDSGDPGDTLAEYQYDGANRRIQKVVTEDGGGPSETHYFYNQSWQLLEERFVNGQGATVASNQYVWSPRYIDALIVRFNDGNGDGDCLDTGDNVPYYTSDANFNVTATIDAGSGDVVERYVYTAYGTATVYSAWWTTPGVPAADGPLYCGYFFDAETALYQVRNRYYDSSLSSFMSRDRVQADANLYRYARDNPTVYVDPSGLACSAAVYTSPVLGTGFNHTCIQVERDEIRDVLDYYEGRWEWRQVTPPTRHYDECGNVWESPGQQGLFQIWIPHYRQIVVHAVYAIELTLGPLSGSLGPNGAILGSGPVGGGVLGNIPGASWYIVRREGKCKGTAHDIDPGSKDACAVVQSLFTSATLVGQASNGKPYYLFGPNGEWLGDDANTCNSVTWQILISAGIEIGSGWGQTEPGWGTPYSR